MEKNQERLQVIENIKNAANNREFDKKVELNDPVITEKLRQERIVNFDILRKNPINKIKRKIARNIALNYAEMFNNDTEIIGLENLESVKGGAIITSNHFSVKDSTMIFHTLKQIGKQNKLNIIVEEENILMEGHFGFILNNCGTIPISQNKEYYNKRFLPAVEKLLQKNEYVLVYPEEQMWFNYKKPRPCKIGAYHLATKNNVPVIPFFIEMREKDGFDQDGFKNIRYIIHIMKPIYPDVNKDLKTNKTEMRDKDYKLKVEAYEKAYDKKLDYNFEDWDIAGLV